MERWLCLAELYLVTASINWSPFDTFGTCGLIGTWTSYQLVLPNNIQVQNAYQVLLNQIIHNFLFLAFLFILQISREVFWLFLIFARRGNLYIERDHQLWKKKMYRHQSVTGLICVFQGKIILEVFIRENIDTQTQK